MSEYSFSINRAGDLFRVGMVICIPLFIIILQNDTGSGILEAPQRLLIPSAT